MGQTLILYLLGFTFLYIIFELGKFFYRILYSVNFSRTSRSFERVAGQPTILVFGDSLGFGTGASVPEKSLIGLLANDYPQATVVNYAVVGFSLHQIAHSLKTTGVGNIIIICGGGIDILFFKPLKQITKDITEIFALASKKGQKTIIVTALNPGLSTIFPWFLRGFYLRRSKKIGEIYELEAKNYPHLFVSNNLLINSVSSLPPWDEISSVDKIHPNDAGYRWAYGRVKPLLKK